MGARRARQLAGKGFWWERELYVGALASVMNDYESAVERVCVGARAL